MMIILFFFSLLTLNESFRMSLMQKYSKIRYQLVSDNNVLSIADELNGVWNKVYILCQIDNNIITGFSSILSRHLLVKETFTYQVIIILI